eukprot:7881123-Alexandrium_andersonii.AAC.1
MCIRDRIPSPWPPSERWERAPYRTDPLGSERVGAEAGVFGKMFGTFARAQQRPVGPECRQ